MPTRKRSTRKSSVSNHTTPFNPELFDSRKYELPWQLHPDSVDVSGDDYISIELRHNSDRLDEPRCQSYRDVHAVFNPAKGGEIQIVIYDPETCLPKWTICTNSPSVSNAQGIFQMNVDLLLGAEPEQEPEPSNSVVSEPFPIGSQVRLASNRAECRSFDPEQVTTHDFGCDCSECCPGSNQSLLWDELFSESNESPQDDSLTPKRKYVPRGTARTTNRYYRYSYKLSGKVRHCHIPGGPVGSAVADARWQQVQEAKREGWPADQIVQLIDSWR